MLINTYFNAGAGGIFGWGMTYIEGEVAINSTISLSTHLEVSTNGIDYVGLGVALTW